MSDCSIIPSQLLAEHGIQAFFTTRKGGVSPPPYDSFNFAPDAEDDPEHIHTNLRRLVARTGLLAPPHQARQVHQCASIWCSGSGSLHNSEADILLSSVANTSVAVRTADCLPILLADPVAGIVAAVHAGWRGTAAGVVTAAIHEMVEHGGNTAHILASLGPCIGPCCFTIGEEAAIALASSVDGAHHHIQPHPLQADLVAINHLQLMASGITEQHIEHCSQCTACNPEHFFSYRRDGHHSGRQLAVVAIPSAT
ncbi:MAG: peptidoglycan editing factor PgeF [Zetaproteobacteria bacterium CG12_big_fil_rev_8_21_14_0_65_54_13]|nr:MAG: peptidoglycan editing factor PgeF [Zetaproteobacteria bacterium CG12_big_fil_rev_8_21_14_0_65_54_13]PIX55882.1 MAG: peptidoglycan editing factor PgeF [Zetaproteobacteria bacterium CG_4_10_14_3_um_filter_54_28]PJA28735.1 MAG: peptidoglycan editing factor PgeF [Zetaproteobacteria bacterium CG_4_9_14_3_um_filter_54_145]